MIFSEDDLLAIFHIDDPEDENIQTFFKASCTDELFQNLENILLYFDDSDSDDSDDSDYNPRYDEY